jgi:Dinucleotide-utilizing enzymes involved in molybdopterin and thiamine biosynthesis family 1
MSQLLINHSADLKRLRDKGYEVEVRGGYLLVHHIPYVGNDKEIRFGTLVSTLTLKNETTTGKPDNHVIHFIGDNPCNIDGTVITAIQHDNSPKNFGSVTINRSFSNKPPQGYSNYYEKVKRYADIISAPAKYLDSNVTEKTFKLISDTTNETVFQYIDTNSSRANIDLINAKLAGQKVAVVGLGGTGAYVLDLISKTPVAEIHLFDGDDFDQHNAFRSPGAASIDDLNKKQMKAEYLSGIYSNMHKHIIPHSYYLQKDNMQELDEMSFVFICVDKNSVRNMIANYLVRVNVPCIDVGLGVETVDDKLRGAIRVTTVSKTKNDHLPNRIFAEDDENNDYITNIQIAELNSLNACMAVIKWKKLSGFYVDQENEHHSVYAIGTSKIINDDFTT